MPGKNEKEHKQIKAIKVLVGELKQIHVMGPLAPLLTNVLIALEAISTYHETLLLRVDAAEAEAAGKTRAVIGMQAWREMADHLAEALAGDSGNYQDGAVETMREDALAAYRELCEQEEEVG